jgi:putative transposase
MCNDAIRIALKEEPKSRFKLQEFAYPRLKAYGLHTHYILAACETAYSIYRNRCRKSVPIIKHVFLKVDNQTYKLNHWILRIPARPKEFIYLVLQGSDYHMSFIDDPNLKRGEVTITERVVSIAFSKEISEIKPQGQMGVDINERNVTIATTNGHVKRFNELAEVADIKQTYRDIRAKIGRLKGWDRRVSQQLFAKYGRRERNRSVQRLHKVSDEIVAYAKANSLLIVMECLTGIRRLYRKGNGQGRDYHARMNSWMFHETQRQIDYKARWEGILVPYVSPRGSSRKCPDCGSRVVPLKDRKLYCPWCDNSLDRDELAGRNLMACAVPQARLPKGSNELDSKTQEEVGGPLSKWAEVKSQSDGAKRLCRT